MPSFSGLQLQVPVSGGPGCGTLCITFTPSRTTFCTLDAASRAWPGETKRERNQAPRWNTAQSHLSSATAASGDCASKSTSPSDAHVLTPRAVGIVRSRGARIKATGGTDVAHQPSLKFNGTMDDLGGLSVTTKVLKGERGGRRARTKDGSLRKPGHGWL